MLFFSEMVCDQKDVRISYHYARYNDLIRIIPLKQFDAVAHFGCFPGPRVRSRPWPSRRQFQHFFFKEKLVALIRISDGGKMHLKSREQTKIVRSHLHTGA